MHPIVKIAARLRPRVRGRRGIPHLWLMTDVARLPDPAGAISRLPRGSGVIVRHTDPVERRVLAGTLVPLCRRRGLICLIAADWRLAARMHADGVHLPERSAKVGVAAGALLWRRQRKRMLTTAAHGFAAMINGARVGTDAILLAPVFATESHPTAQAIGVPRFAVLVRVVSCPVIALGGISDETIMRLAGTCASGIAGIGWAATAKSA